MRTIAIRSLSIALLSAAALCQSAAIDQAAIDAIREPAQWSRRDVGAGMQLLQRRFDALFVGAQSLTVLRIEPDAPSLRFDVEAPGKLTRTSAMAKKHGAIAAINGGFFEPDASPRGLLKLDGKLANAATEGQGSVGVDAKGRLAIERRAIGDWSEMREALGAGVVLVNDGKPVDHGKRQRGIRHPRSAIGRTKDGALVLLAVDGRTEQAKGMSYEELAHVLLAFDCEFAINLDGGGSTTLWTAERGVCNYPCDNKKFDHEGERAVGNALLVMGRAAVEIDDDDATFSGRGFSQRTDVANARGKDCATWTGEAELSAQATATFAAQLPFDGNWTAFVWLPDATESRNAFRAGASIGDAAPKLDGAPHTGKPGAWVEIGVVELKKPGRASIAIAAARGLPFVADAVKFEQRD
jgi:uncharacterized protein YigE (DUF2233 family)